jgi:hypothetical protein
MDITLTCLTNVIQGTIVEFKQLPWPTYHVSFNFVNIFFLLELVLFTPIVQLLSLFNMHIVTLRWKKEHPKQSSIKHFHNSDLRDNWQIHGSWLLGKMKWWWNTFHIWTFIPSIKLFFLTCTSHAFHNAFNFTHNWFFKMLTKLSTSNKIKD